MFYNYDYLISEKIGLRIPWLASTLGNANASAFRKLSKRDIVALDVTKSCETVSNPPAPMALRISGHLMYGVVRIYTKQTDYWINDVQASYSSIRKILMQTQRGAITTLGGVVIVGQDTSTIDLPGRDREIYDTVTLQGHYGLSRYNLHLDVDWFDTAPSEAQEGNSGLPSWSDSLSLFGSSVYDTGSEQGREASLGLEFDPPRNQPFTAEPSTIRRGGSDVRHEPQMDIDPFDLDNIDLPPAGNDGVQLDLGLDSEAPFGEVIETGVLDDQAGFDILDFEAEEHLQHRPPSPNTNDERPLKRLRNALEDRRLELSDERIADLRRNYPILMSALRSREEIRRLAKEAEREVRSLIFGPNANFTHAAMLVNFWTSGIDAGLLRLDQQAIDVQLGRGRGREGQAEAPWQHEQSIEMRFEEGEVPQWQDDQPFEAPRASTPEWEAEIGRGGPSDPLDLPWNRTTQDLLIADDTLAAAETTIGISTRSFSIETPTGLRRLARPSSLSGRTSIDQPLTHLSGGELAGGEESGQVPDSQMFVEQDLVNFYHFVRAVNSGQGDQPLFFSDLAPVADTSPGVAARAFHHVLSLATADRVSAQQSDAYGEIKIELV